MSKGFPSPQQIFTNCKLKDDRTGPFARPAIELTYEPPAHLLEYDNQGSYRALILENSTELHSQSWIVTLEHLDPQEHAYYAVTLRPDRDLELEEAVREYCQSIEHAVVTICKQICEDINHRADERFRKVLADRRTERNLDAAIALIQNSTAEYLWSQLDE